MPQGCTRMARSVALASALALAWWIAPPALARQHDKGADAAPGAQQHDEAEIPTVEFSPAARTLIDAAYLTDAERAALRVRHGVWTSEDLTTPLLRAAAAMLTGAWDSPALQDAEVPVEMRADSMLRRGDIAEALAALEGATTLAATRIRAEALEALGRFEEADAAAEPAAKALASGEARTAQETTDMVRALWVRARVKGEPAEGYKRMLAALAEGRERDDRLDPTSMLAEARLLYEKDNRPQAGEAALQALSVCPSLADAWELLGRMAVDGFNFDAARGAAARLDTIAEEMGGGAGESAQACLIRSLCWLRQNEPALAREALAPALARFPRMRDALALRCAALALERDTDGLRDALGQFAALSPGSPIALHAIGKAYSEARQYDDAAEYLNQAIALQPKWPAPLIDLGLLELQSGRDHEALAALERVATLDPFNVRAANSLTLVRELQTYDRVASDHFEVRFKPGVDRVLAEEMLPLLERIYGIVCVGPESVQHEPSRKTVIDLMPDHEWFAVRITGMPDIHTVAASTGPVIAMEAPKVGPGHEMGEYDWVRVVRHEYVHTVTLSRTKNRIPHWFTEAAAVHYEGGPIEYDTAALLTRALTSNTLFDMREINIAFVLPKKPTDRAQAYAQGHHMYEFMLERFGRQAPLDLMDLYAEGVREDEAMRRVLKVPSDEFLASFKEWLRARATAWGMLPEPSIESIVFDEAMNSDVGREAAALALDSGVARLAGVVSGGWSPDPEGFEAPGLSPAALERIGAERPDHPDVLRLRIRMALHTANDEPTPEMIPLLERYAAVRPVDPLPHKLLARLYMASSAETEDRAIEHLEYLDAREQNSPAYAAELARRYGALKRYEPAEAKAERATQIAPFNASMRELAATASLLAGDLGAAERHIAALTVLEPDRPVHAQRLQKVREKRGAEAPAAQPTAPPPGR